MSKTTGFNIAPADLQVMNHLRECPGCGLFQRLPDLAPGQLARCTRCRCRLQRRCANSSTLISTALTVCSAIFYLLAVSQPVMTFDIHGRSRAVSLLTGPLELVHEGWAPVAFLVMLTTVVFPAVVIGLMLTIALNVARGRISTSTARRLRWYERLRPWSMIEVYVLGVFVAYSKLVDLARVEFDTAIYAIVGLMITMALTDASLQAELIWRRKPINATVVGDRADTAGSTELDIDGGGSMPPWKMVACTACGLVCSAAYPLKNEAPIASCPRCGQMLRRRKPDSARRTATLLMAAIILYIPANLFPIMTVIQFYRGGSHTIVEGVRELYVAGMLPLALLVFFASITVPVLKILSLGVMVLGVWRGSASWLVDRSKLYWAVDFIGRWSMIDVFMVSILVGLVQFGALGNVTANVGIEFFASVVVLTIFAANAFDPRIMWDAAGLNGVRQSARPPRRAIKQAPDREVPKGEAAEA